MGDIASQKRAAVCKLPLLLGFYISQDFLQDIIWRDGIGDDFQICILARVGQAGLLVFVFGVEPVEAAGDAGFMTALKIDQNIGVRDLLPHARSE